MHTTRSSTAAGGRRRHFSAFSFIVVAAVGCCLALAACGGSGSGDPSGEATGQKAIEQKMVKFAKCMREHGVGAETTTGSNGHGFGLKISAAGGPPHTGGAAAERSKSFGPPPQVERAMNACKKYQPKPTQEDLSPAEKAEQAKKGLEFARCMRSHGVEVPDPGPSGVLELNNVNPQSATFERAQNACQHLMGRAPLAIRSRGSAGPPGGAGGSETGSIQSAAPAGGGEK